MLRPGRDTAIEWHIANEPGAVKRMVRKIRLDPFARQLA
jgi:hypothetical protein